ncbi:MAG: hypothetical protein IJN58_08315 [Clostridia bacterium]|nr:hypothetical protein [Clostridia bacterium]
MVRVRVYAQQKVKVKIGTAMPVYTGRPLELGSKAVTENGHYRAAQDSLDGYTDFQVNVPDPVLQKLTITPTISEQTFTPPDGVDGFSPVVTKAMPQAQQATPVIEMDENGKVTATANQQAGYVVEGTKSESLQLETQKAQIITPGDALQEIPAGVYLTGKQTIARVPTQEKTVTENGEYEADAGKYFKKVTVNVPATEQTPPKLQEKSADPSTSQQEFTPDPGYDGISKFIVNAVRQAAQGEPTIAVDDAGQVTATVTQEEGYVPAGIKSAIKQLPTKAAATYTPGDSKQTIPAGVFLTGDQTIAPVPTQEKTATENGEVVADAGKYLTKVIVDVQPEVDGEIVLDPTDVKFGSEAIDPDQLYKIGYNWLAQVVDHLQDMVGKTASFTLEEIVYWLGRVKYLPQGNAESTMTIGLVFETTAQ